MRGVQRPRVEWVPPYASSSGDEAVELASASGIVLDPWQQHILRESLGESPDWKCPRCTHRTALAVPCPDHPEQDLLHPWSAFEVTVVVPRQNGKSELLVARQLAGLFLLGEDLIIYSAHLFDTAMEVFRRLVSVVENCDDLRREVKHRGSKLVGIKYSHGEEGIELRSGQRIRFKARTAGGGRGFSCDHLQLDEAMILPERFLGATVPTLSARANPQIFLAGSAPDDEDPSHDGVVLTRRRQRAMTASDPSLAYFEHSMAGDSPESVDPAVLDDPAQWAIANPAMGQRITTEYIANERRAMGARQFALERCGIAAWSNLDVDAGRLISQSAWAALADPSSRIAKGHTFALDVDPGQAWATIAAAGERDDGLMHIGIVEHSRGTGWIVQQCAEWLEKFPGSQLVIDPRADLGSLMVELDDAGVQPVRTTAADYKDACGGFFQAIVQQRLRYRPPQPELDSAVAGARTRKLLDAWKWDRTSSGSLITPLIASTLALWGARTQSAPRVWDLNETAAAIALRDREPVGADASGGAAGQRFVSLNDLPGRRGLFG